MIRDSLDPLLCVQIVGALTLFMYGVAWPMLMVVVVLLHRCTELPKVNARSNFISSALKVATKS